MQTVDVTTVPCIFCKQASTVTIPLKAYTLYKRGEMIQRAWPEGSVGDRELLISGVHSDCWDMIFDETDFTQEQEA